MEERSKKKKKTATLEEEDCGGGIRVFGGHKGYSAYGSLPAEMARLPFPTPKDRSCVEERHGWVQHSCAQSLVNRLSTARPPSIDVVTGGVHLSAGHLRLNPARTKAHAYAHALVACLRCVSLLRPSIMDSCMHERVRNTLEKEKGAR